MCTSIRITYQTPGPDDEMKTNPKVEFENNIPVMLKYKYGLGLVESGGLLNLQRAWYVS